MSFAIVKAPIAPLYVKADSASELADEALFGMVVEILERLEGDWARVRTHYRYEGYTRLAYLVEGDERANAWKVADKRIGTAPMLDIMRAPKVQAGHLAHLPKGGLLKPTGEETEPGWTQVEIPTGEIGYARASRLGDPIDTGDAGNETALRAAILRAAHAYLGTQYRWGGKTHMGIDCSGLVSMAYLLNGILIFRDAAIREGFPIRQIPFERIQPADLMFSPGHVVMYIGEDRYIHSTGRAGDDGVVINSLNPADDDYRADLADALRSKVGSAF